MAKEKKSFFERLTGTVRLDEKETAEKGSRDSREADASKENWVEEEEKDAELTVDVSQTPDEIIVKAMVAGVHPEDLDVDITRDMVTIKGHREEEHTSKDEDFFVQELYWGGFSRSITLPEEIDVDASEAIEKHGLLILKLPKIDKGRKTKLKIKTV
jgi:HSP20 family protein